MLLSLPNTTFPCLHPPPTPTCYSPSTGPGRVAGEAEDKDKIYQRQRVPYDFKYEVDIHNAEGTKVGTVVCTAKGGLYRDVVPGYKQQTARQVRPASATCGGELGVGVEPCHC